MLEWLKESKEDRNLLEDVVRHFHPSMRVIHGIGGWCLVMSAEEGRRTAKNKGENYGVPRMTEDK